MVSLLSWFRSKFRGATPSPQRNLLLAMFRDLGFSRKSANLRADLFEKLSECERRGIDPIAGLRKTMPDIRIPGIPAISIPLGQIGTGPPPPEK